MLSTAQKTEEGYKAVNCSFTKRIEWIALVMAVHLVGSRVLLEDKPARSVISLGWNSWRLHFFLTEE